MRLPRAPLFVALIAASASLTLSTALATWKPDCLQHLQSDLKRQDLAEAIGLTYYSERPAGITRKVKSRKTKKTVTDKKGVAATKEVTEHDVTYVDPTGKPIEDADAIAAYDEFDIPKTYESVWISPDPRSHVLAIAVDSRNRAQYFYHPLWEEATTVTKYIRMENFGKRISGMRRTMAKDLRSRGINRRKLLAAAATILQTGNIRVGSAKYAKDNGSYGLTTLLHEHVRVDGAKIAFDFVGKEGVAHEFTIVDAEVAKVFAELLRGKGPRLFEFTDADGAVKTITAKNVSDYLAEISGGEAFTAKDFRTWQGTTAAAEKLLELGAHTGEKDAAEKIKAAVKHASERLRNTPAIARERYVFGLVLDAYAAGKPFEDVVKWLAKNPDPELPDPERLVLELIRRNAE